MNELKPPHQLARVCAQCHYRIRPLVIAGTQAAEVVGTGATRGNKNQASLRIHRHDGPSIAGARLKRLLCSTPFRRARTGRRDRIPTPPKGSGTNIERTDYTARHVHAGIVIDRRTNDYHVVHNCWRRSHVIPTWVEAGYIAKAYLSVLPKIGTSAACGGIDRNQPGINRRLEQTPATGRTGRSLVVKPGRQAAVDQAIA